MTEEKTKLVFKAIFLLEDFREILRETAPLHQFNEEQSERAIKLLDNIDKIIKKLTESVKVELEH
ncbi:MAG: hypothetical protein ACTSQY_01865 [Candidatus Odinarchaeia archaeon]